VVFQRKAIIFSLRCRAGERGAALTTT